MQQQFFSEKTSWFWLFRIPLLEKAASDLIGRRWAISALCGGSECRACACCRPRTVRWKSSRSLARRIPCSRKATNMVFLAGKRLPHLSHLTRIVPINLFSLLSFLFTLLTVYLHLVVNFGWPVKNVRRKYCWQRFSSVLGKFVFIFPVLEKFAFWVS